MGTSPINVNTDVADELAWIPTHIAAFLCHHASNRLVCDIGGLPRDVFEAPRVILGERQMLRHQRLHQFHSIPNATDLQRDSVMTRALAAARYCLAACAFSPLSQSSKTGLLACGGATSTAHPQALVETPSQ